MKVYMKIAKKGHLEDMCDESIEFQRMRRYDLMCMKKKKLGWKENQGTQNIGIEDSQGNITIDQIHVLKVGENYITEIHHRTNRREKLRVETEEEVAEDEIFCTVKWKSCQGDEG